jgi:L-alanine-DL-glutamate epimerase-like enolase superfamily enzyme
MSAVSMRAVAAGAQVEDVQARAYTIPTDSPESDGTLEWDSTTLVLALVRAEGAQGLGWTYGDQAIAPLIEGKLADVLRGRDALEVRSVWAAMVAELRNNGRPGLSSMAIAAVDVALWDLKARLLELPLSSLVGRFHAGVPIYGSGGFTSYSDARLAAQLSGWASQGIPRVKIKIGREADRDPERLRVAREAIGPEVQLFVDANGAFRPKEAVRMAEQCARWGVRWFEEPVSSDDLAGLRMVRERVPAQIDIAAGEYGYDLPYFEHMLAAGAVDVLQADVTRCGGITELLRVDGLCRARSMPLSLHCSPTIHAAIGPALETLVHLEYFHDHVRIEHMLFEGVPEPVEGTLYPALDRPGLGVAVREEAARFAV